MASNYLDVHNQLQAAGLLVDDLDVGRLRRCRVEGEGRERKGWYWLHEIRLDDGTEVLVGSYGVWRGADSNTEKVKLNLTSKPNREQSEAIRKRLAEDRRRAEGARKAEAQRAAQRATAAWKRYQPTGESEYLQRKGVGAYGLRFADNGTLIIPLLDAQNHIHGLQVVRGKNRAAGKMEKEYWPAGLEKKGKFHLIGLAQDGGILLLAEGYATGASLHACTGLPVAVAFDANNLAPVAAALTKRYKGLRVLVCADDDNTQRCHAENAQATAEAGLRVECKTRVWLPDGPNCPHCGQEHKGSNAGVTMASTAAMQVGGAWMAPQFSDVSALRQDWLERGQKLNDFNDLHLRDGLHVVRAQVEARLLELGWKTRQQATRQAVIPAGQANAVEVLSPLLPVDSLDELLERFALVYGQGGAVFDHAEHRLVSLTDMGHLCLNSDVFSAWRESPGRLIVRPEEVGFDPAGKDRNITCNLWGGWPTKPRDGECPGLLNLLWHMCSEEGGAKSEELYNWVLKWLAYPLQHPGAKMKTTIVMHGPQGTGKNMFFEAYMQIYGKYGWTVDQSAIEDKFNDWASRKLFLIADEVVARSELFHVKNKLKAFITGDQIRINPKNMQAYYEANHVNMVFLSNETMPVVLEEDDRRHAVIWTPAKLDRAFYAQVQQEIDEGGAMDLYNFLLNLDLTGFNYATLPPMTAAKEELIGLSIDSPSKFMRALEAGEVPGFPGRGRPALLSPCLSLDMYEVYRTWCATTGERPLTQPRFQNAITRKHGATVRQKRYETITGVKGPVSVLFLDGGHELPAGAAEVPWLGQRIEIFKTALKDLRGGVQ